MLRVFFVAPEKLSAFNFFRTCLPTFYVCVNEPEIGPTTCRLNHQSIGPIEARSLPKPKIGLLLWRPPVFLERRRFDQVVSQSFVRKQTLSSSPFSIFVLL